MKKNLKKQWKRKKERKKEKKEKIQDLINFINFLWCHFLEDDVIKNLAFVSFKGI